MDPVLNRPLGVNATALAGLEMRRWLHVTGRSETECAEVAARNREHARGNPRASYADVRDDTPLFDPLTKEQAAEPADGCVVLVLANEDRAPADAVFVDGVGWSPGRAVGREPRLGPGGGGRARRRGRLRARRVAPSDVEIAEVDDTYAYKQLQHLDALGLGELDAGPA